MNDVFKDTQPTVLQTMKTMLYINEQYLHFTDLRSNLYSIVQLPLFIQKLRLLFNSIAWYLEWSECSVRNLNEQTDVTK